MVGFGVDKPRALAHLFNQGRDNAIQLRLYSRAERREQLTAADNCVLGHVRAERVDRRHQRLNKDVKVALDKVRAEVY